MTNNQRASRKSEPFDSLPGPVQEAINAHAKYYAEHHGLGMSLRDDLTYIAQVALRWAPKPTPSDGGLDLAQELRTVLSWEGKRMGAMSRMCDHHLQGHCANHAVRDREAHMDMMDEFHPANGLSVSEAERLALLLEEAGEVVQAIGKVLRHGYESWNPNDPRRTSNRESLERELGDMAAAIQLMTGRRDLNAAFIKQCQVDKLKKVGQYLHHQPSEG